MSQSKFTLINTQKDILCKALVERHLGKGKGIVGSNILFDCIVKYSVIANDFKLVDIWTNTKISCKKFEHILEINGITLDISNNYFAYFRNNHSFPEKSLWEQLAF